MKKTLIVLFLSTIAAVCYAQYGFRCGEHFISLSRTKSPVFFTIMSNQEKDFLVARKGTNFSQLSANYYIVDTLFRKNIEADYMSDFYISLHGYLTIILPQIVVSVESEKDLQALLNLYKDVISLSHKINNSIVLNCKCNNSEDILKMVLAIEKANGVKWCKPGMLSEIKFENNNDNPYYVNQYYLMNNTDYGGTETAAISANKAWDIISANANIKVAVIDQGVEHNHEDLQGVVLDGFTASVPSGIGEPINHNEYCEKGHGTSCAGIIAAIDNDKGIKGIASGVKILPINISPNYVERIVYPNGYYYDQYLFCNSDSIAFAINWAVDHGADIISCSWSHEEDTSITNAFNYAITSGRNGKGCVVVAASGNNYMNGSLSPGYPSNLAGVLCVGAVDRNGTVWNYCQRGSSLDLVAPSGNINLNGDIVTTDRMGSFGYNPSVGSGSELTNQNYTQRFGGTSAACPQVAGVAALMLSANPNLTELEVRNILKNTAKKLSGMNGLNRTDDYGYGLVDAYKAVVGAYKLAISGPEYPCSSGIYSIANLPTGYTVDWSISPAVSFLNTSILTTNSPQQNQCTITNTTVFPWSTTLFAAIKNPSGTTVTTLSKRVRNTFDLTFSQSGFGSYPSIPASTVVSNGTIVVNHKCWVTLSSPYFSGMTILHTGATPQAFEMLNGDITFKFSTVTSTQNMTILGQDGCKVMRLLVQVSPNSNIPIPMLSVSPNGEGFEVELTYEGDEEDVRSLTERLQDIEWELNIANAVSGEKVRSLRVKGPKVTVSTVGWKSGIYVLQGIVNGQECSKKVTIK